MKVLFGPKVDVMALMRSINEDMLPHSLMRPVMKLNFPIMIHSSLVPANNFYLALSFVNSF